MKQYIYLNIYFPFPDYCTFFHTIANEKKLQGIIQRPGDLLFAMQGLKIRLGPLQKINILLRESPNSLLIHPVRIIAFNRLFRNLALLY